MAQFGIPKMFLYLKVHQVKGHNLGIPKTFLSFYILGTSSKSAHFWDLKNVHFYLMYFKYGSRRWLCESKHVAIFIIDNKLVVFWLNQLLEYLFNKDLAFVWVI